VWDGHLESRKNPDRLKRSIDVDRIGVHSTFVYIYAGLRALMIWANCLFSFKMSFLLRKVEDVTTISKSQSLTSVSIKDCTLRVPNETTTLFLLRVIIKAIFIHTQKSGTVVSRRKERARRVCERRSPEGPNRAKRGSSSEEDRLMVRRAQKVRRGACCRQ